MSETSSSIKKRNPSAGNKSKKKKKRQYVTELRPDDVLLGRGAQSIQYNGNKRFRELVAAKKTEYLDCTRNIDKNIIAADIIQEIQKRGGRFLQRVDSHQEVEKLNLPDGTRVWFIVEMSIALEKSKQALREKESKSASVEEIPSDDINLRHSPHLERTVDGHDRRDHQSLIQRRSSLPVNFSQQPHILQQQQQAGQFLGHQRHLSMDNLPQLGTAAALQQQQQLGVGAYASALPDNTDQTLEANRLTLLSLQQQERDRQYLINMAILQQQKQQQEQYRQNQIESTLLQEQRRRQLLSSLAVNNFALGDTTASYSLSGLAGDSNGSLLTGRIDVFGPNSNSIPLLAQRRLLLQQQMNELTQHQLVNDRATIDLNIGGQNNLTHVQQQQSFGAVGDSFNYDYTTPAPARGAGVAALPEHCESHQRHEEVENITTQPKNSGDISSRTWLTKQEETKQSERWKTPQDDDDDDNEEDDMNNRTKSSPGNS